MKSLIAISIVALSLSLNAFAADSLASKGEYGGTCAEGLAMGKEMKTDCKISWIDAASKKTYCFSSEGMKTAWAKDTKTNVMKADAEYAKMTAEKAMMEKKKEGIEKMNDKMDKM